MRETSVLMVCTGNICRSLMAHAVLEQAYADSDLAGRIQLQVDSAGVSNEEQGNPPDYRAARVLTSRGWQVPDHRAQQITRLDLEGFSLILAMTTGHYRALLRLAERYGVDANKIRYYRHFDPLSDPNDLEVPDPWYGGMSDFEDTLDVIERTTPELLAALAEGEI